MSLSHSHGVLSRQVCELEGEKKLSYLEKVVAKIN